MKAINHKAANVHTLLIAMLRFFGIMDIGQHKMKLKIQAQHLQPGDIVGSGEIIKSTGIGVKTPKGKVEVILGKVKDGALYLRSTVWGKYTIINVERKENGA